MGSIRTELAETNNVSFMMPLIWLLWGFSFFLILRTFLKIFPETPLLRICSLMNLSCQVQISQPPLMIWLTHPPFQTIVLPGAKVPCQRLTSSPRTREAWAVYPPSIHLSDDAMYYTGLPLLQRISSLMYSLQACVRTLQIYVPGWMSRFH